MQTYQIVGADQKEHGPLTGDEIRQWIIEGRANAQSKVRVGEDWKPLAAIPEFAETLNRRTRLLVGAQPAVPGKTSGLAGTSLWLGVLGLPTCGLTAIVGLVLGIIAMVRIKKSGGQLNGWGTAVAGTIVSGIFVLMLVFYCREQAKSMHSAYAIHCASSMRQLALAVRTYSAGHDDHIPPAATWCDAILSEVGSEKVFKCPEADANERCHYAFNAKLGGLIETNVAPDTVMIFEARGGWNQNGGAELLLQPPRHPHKYVVALADGTVTQVSEKQLNTLRWNP
jgi:hypothetical protein